MHDRRHVSAFGHIDQHSVELRDEADNPIKPVLPSVILRILG